MKIFQRWFSKTNKKNKIILEQSKTINYLFSKSNKLETQFTTMGIPKFDALIDDLKNNIDQAICRFCNGNGCFVTNGEEHKCQICKGWGFNYYELPSVKQDNVRIKIKNPAMSCLLCEHHYYCSQIEIRLKYNYALYCIKFECKKQNDQA